jgi:methyl-accepting chemotaxis protein
VDRAAAVIEETAGLAGEASGVLQQIMRLVDSTADQIRSIATASEQQSATSDAINQSIGEIKSIAEATADTMQQSIHVVASVTDQVGELSALIMEMQSKEQS